MASSDSPPVVGLDTSVVLRLLLAEPSRQADVALAFLKDLASRGKRAIVSDLVLSEAYFALHAHYEVPKKTAIKVLLAFVKSELVESDERGAALEALESMLDSAPKPGFVDRLIHAQYGNIPAALVTFERASAKLENVVVLKA